MADLEVLDLPEVGEYNWGIKVNAAFTQIFNAVNAGGMNGLSAYELAQSEGFTGSLTQWFQSLVGDAGLSAYQLAVNNGFQGDLPAWLASLTGKSAYQSWLSLGNTGNEATFIASLKGEPGEATDTVAGAPGKSAYQLAQEMGFTGTLEEWLESLGGGPGLSAYDIWLGQGNVGTEADFLDSLKADAPAPTPTAPTPFPEPVIPLPVLASPTRIVNVSTKAQLDAAIADLRWSDRIVLSAGTYTYASNLVIMAPPMGEYTVSNPPPGIHIIGSGTRASVISRGSSSSGYALHLDRANYVQIENVTITGGQKGVMADETNFSRLVNVSVGNCGHEGVHWRNFSSDNLIQGSRVHHTGLTDAQYGEGIYFGQSVSNWDAGTSRTGGLEDRSDRNQAINNTLDNISGEPFDVKEGTTGGVIRGNTIDGAAIAGENSADSYLDIKGNDYLVENNTGLNPSVALVHGFTTHILYAGYGNRNIFRANSVVAGGKTTNAENSENNGSQGYNIQTSGSRGSAVGNVVYEDNTATSAPGGLTNIPTTPVAIGPTPIPEPDPDPTPGTSTGFSATGLDIRTFFPDPEVVPDNLDAIYLEALDEAIAQNKYLDLAGLRLVGEMVAIDRSARVRHGTMVAEPNKRVFRSEVTMETPRPLTGPIRTVELAAVAVFNTTMPQRETVRALPVSSASLVGLVEGDELHLLSDDAYPGQYMEGSTEFTWKGGWVTVLGLGLKVAFSGTPALEGTILTGAGGASGRIMAVNVDDAGGHMLVFSKISGSFVAGETVSVAGVAVGTVDTIPVILTTDLLNDTTYDTNPTLYRADRTIKHEFIDIKIDTTTDPFAEMAPNLRKDAIWVRGSVEPVFDIEIIKGYRRGLDIESCRNIAIKVKGGNLPDDASPDKGMFGYAVQISGHTEGGVVDLDVTRVRHAFTTNNDTKPLLPVNNNERLLAGVPKYVRVRGTARYTTAAAFDTHGGCVGIIFDHTFADFPGSAGRDASRDVGYNDRGIGTIYLGARVRGATWGFHNSSPSIDSPSPYTTWYDSIRGYDLRESLFRHGTKTNKGNYALGIPSVVFIDPVGEAVQYPLGAPYTQTGMDLSNANVKIQGGSLRGFNFAGINIRTPLQQLDISDLELDNSMMAPGAQDVNAFGVRFAAEILLSRRAVLDNLRIKDNETGNAWASVIHVVAGITAKVRRNKEGFKTISPTGGVPEKSGPGTLDTAYITRSGNALAASDITDFRAASRAAFTEGDNITFLTDPVTGVTTISGAAAGETGGMTETDVEALLGVQYVEVFRSDGGNGDWPAARPTNIPPGARIIAVGSGDGPVWTTKHDRHYKTKTAVPA